MSAVTSTIRADLESARAALDGLRRSNVNTIYRLRCMVKALRMTAIHDESVGVSEREELHWSEIMDVVISMIPDEDELDASAHRITKAIDQVCHALPSDTVAHPNYVVTSRRDKIMHSVSGLMDKVIALTRDDATLRMDAPRIHAVLDQAHAQLAASNAPKKKTAPTGRRVRAVKPSVES